MTSRRLCSRHGMRFFTMVSPRVAACMSPQCVFAENELVKVSLDRPRRSTAGWMTWAELHEHKAATCIANGIAHVRDLPMIAALQATWQPVCPDCRDELLVRSGVEPESPTPVERAFDSSAIADNAESRRPLFACSVHGISFEHLASPAIVKAVSRSAASLGGRSIEIIVPNARSHRAFWFDLALLRYAMGDDVDVSTGVYQINDTSDSELLRGLAWPVCGHCLEAWLGRDFTSPAS
jgi:hypothetical protein